MAHRLIKLLFLAQFLCLDHVVAFPVLIGRDESGGDSLWRLEWDDVTAGLEALFKVWDFSTAPGVSTTPSGVPSEQSDERRPETPDPVAVPLFEPTEMKTCAVVGGSQGGQFDRLAVENSWWQVEQEPETGRPVISACDLPKGDDNDAYIVQEIRFEDDRTKKRWVAAILVSDPANNVHFRYNVIPVAKSPTYTYQKIPNAIFIRQGKLVKLGYVRRRGWLVGAGQPKEVALKWFEDEVMGSNMGINEGFARKTKGHYSTAWIEKVFAKADDSGSLFWIADR